MFRPGLQPYDVAQFIIATALGLLLQTVPGTGDPDVARRYLETFILPAIVADPPRQPGCFPGVVNPLLPGHQTLDGYRYRKRGIRLGCTVVPAHRNGSGPRGFRRRGRTTTSL